MKYCVLLDTSRVIDAQKASSDILLGNALKIGLEAKQVEILTQEEYDTRKALEPKPFVINPDEILNAKIEIKTINTLIDLGVI